MRLGATVLPMLALIAVPTPVQGTPLQIEGINGANGLVTGPGAAWLAERSWSFDIVPLGTMMPVIGGLVLATFSTLFFVPAMYSFLRQKAPLDLDTQIEDEYHEGEGLQPA